MVIDYPLKYMLLEWALVAVVNRAGFTVRVQ